MTCSAVQWFGKEGSLFFFAAGFFCGFLVLSFSAFHVSLPLMFLRFSAFNVSPLHLLLFLAASLHSLLFCFCASVPYYSILHVLFGSASCSSVSALPSS